MAFLTAEFILKLLLAVGAFLLLLWRVAVWFGRTVSASLQVHQNVEEVAKDLRVLDAKNDAAHDRLQESTEVLRSRLETISERIARLEGMRRRGSNEP